MFCGSFAVPTGHHLVAVAIGGAGQEGKGKADCLVHWVILS